MLDKIKKIMGCVVTLFLTMGMLFVLTNVLERKSSDEKYADFWAQEADFDVLFFGTSHVVNGVYPMELWKEYGIVSYNFGGHANQLATSYWLMENALDYKIPKVVVIDCHTLNGETKATDAFAYIHLSFDTFPLTTTKIKAVLDLLDDPAMDEAIENGTARPSAEARTRMGLLWNYSVYHSRWNEIGTDTFASTVNYEKGAEPRIGIQEGKFEKIDSDLKMEPGTTGDVYLRKMIEDCQSRGIEVLLINLPYPASTYSQMAANYAYDLAEEYGIDYLNFLDLDVIDYQIDMYDKTSHLNVSGARKVTKYIGEYLIENYPVEDQKENPVYSGWNTDYDEYIALKNSNLVKQTDLREYLMLLAGDDVDVYMDIHNSALLQDAQIRKLVENIGMDIDSVTNKPDKVCENINGTADVCIDVYRKSILVDSVRFVYRGTKSREENEFISIR